MYFCIAAMQEDGLPCVCPPSCPCWPIPGDTFTKDEHKLLLKLASWPLEHPFAHLKRACRMLIQRGDRKRLAYVLSVPVQVMSRQYMGHYFVLTRTTALGYLCRFGKNDARDIEWLLNMGVCPWSGFDIAIWTVNQRHSFEKPVVRHPGRMPHGVNTTPLAIAMQRVNYHRAVVDLLRAAGAPPIVTPTALEDGSYALECQQWRLWHLRPSRRRFIACFRDPCT